ncbi:protein mono-ADP-ribosyltransferase PARP12-like isoform X2 [Babylonia areolata]|uniref:protein mono-ADP-ribosyltransferase PARP12-like isoform X2 n=1 Tax=Babylonia areolata TaxID=304850 RepID=UPI003FD0273C
MYGREQKRSWVDEQGRDRDQRDGQRRQLYHEALISLLAQQKHCGVCQLDVPSLFQRLGARKCRKFGVHHPDELEQCLKLCTLLFVVETTGRPISISTVSPRTSLAVCPAHSNKSGSCPDGSCPDLHVCRFFLLSGQCSFENRCLFGHDLRTPHNQRLLQRHLLDGIDITRLRSLFCLPTIRQGVTLPQVCRYYNVHRGCSKGNDCRFLHLCRHYMLEQCRFGKKCERNHNINHPQVKDVLCQFGLDVAHRRLSDIVEEVKLYVKKLADQDSDEEHCPRGHASDGGARPKRCKSVPNLSRQQKFTFADESPGSATRAPSASRPSAYSRLAGGQSAPPKTEEICLYYLKGACRFGDKCNKLHSPQRYLWRIAAAGDDYQGALEWCSLPDDSNEALEKAFSLPHQTDCIVTDRHGEEMTVLFRSMKAEKAGTKQQYRVCRVSTPSSMHPSMKGSKVGSCSNAHLATVWLWFWKNLDGVWSEFGFEETGRLSMTSETLEENHQMGAVTVTMGGGWVLDLAKKRLKNLKTSSKFKVRRRPKLVLSKDRAELDSGSSPSDGSNDDDEGGTWNCVGGEEDTGNDSSDKEDRWRHTATASGGQRVAYSHKANDDDVEEEEQARASGVSAHRFLSPVRGDSERYLREKQHFVETLSVASHVLDIHAVNNPQLTERYERMRSQMLRQFGVRGVTEQVLYYGPSPEEDVNTICRNGVACNSTVAPGKGGHFHVNAARANKGSRGSGGERRVLFRVKCLLGPDRRVDDADDRKTFIISNPAQEAVMFAEL